MALTSPLCHSTPTQSMAHMHPPPPATEKWHKDDLTPCKPLQFDWGSLVLVRSRSHVTVPLKSHNWHVLGHFSHFALGSPRIARADVCVCVCVCVCVVCAVAHFRVAGGAILGALRADRSALYPYMAYHGASPYLREVHPLTSSGEYSEWHLWGPPVVAMWACQRST